METINKSQEELADLRLNGLFQIEECMNHKDSSLQNVIDEIFKILPSCFQYSKFIEIEITINQNTFKSDNFKFTSWLISEPIVIQDKEIGIFSVAYVPDNQNHQWEFLENERKLLRTIADRLAHFILSQEFNNIFGDLREIKNKSNPTPEWRVVLDMLRQTDPPLFSRIARKLLHTLYRLDLPEADELMKQSSLTLSTGDDNLTADENKPLKKKKINDYDQYIEAILSLAKANLSEDEIYFKVQKWLQDDKSSELVKVLESFDSSLTDIADSIRKYYLMAPEKTKISKTTIKGLRVSLLRRFFSENLEFLKIAKEHVKLTDFYSLIHNMIFPPSSHGSLGGKSSGMFLAFNIIQNKSEKIDILKNIKMPKTWFVASDGILSFMQYNSLEETLEQKYKDVEEVRIEYPQIVQLFKNADFPPFMLKGLSVALDSLGETPLIVRSSSLLEDQMGAAFSGKYKSLFLANQGSKEDRLNALTDAVAEVYASTFGPDPIEYRAERGLLDFHEEMAVMIQEVVGKKVGKYFFPAFAGVAFSNNEFRWSSRINRDDGLIRLVPGLGTRAVDRTGNDYPILITPGQPNLRVNVSIDEIIRYAPKFMDVINLETNEFESIKIDDLIREYHNEYPDLNNSISMIDGNMIRQPIGFSTDVENDDFVVTFNGLLNNTNFVDKLGTVLKTLKDTLNTPVDIEFASDGDDLYLLQCRPQSFTKDNTPDKIPDNIPKENILFKGNKFISNGRVPPVTHIVYVDPVTYSELNDVHTLTQIGRAVGRLNKILPRRKFILMGPGRWGSRGDIKLGVNVTYSDINNTSMLIEIAKQKGSYVPDLSFGTHFFQDLVEASIRYLPLYPDDEDAIFNERFFRTSKNILTEVLPEFDFLQKYISVIDVPSSKNGKILKVLMNGDEGQGLAIFCESENVCKEEKFSKPLLIQSESEESHASWRLSMIKKLADEIDFQKYDIDAIYLEEQQGNHPVEMIVHNHTFPDNINELKVWLEGWNSSFSYMNFLKTGISFESILKITYLTDQDLQEKNEIAIRYNSIKDNLRLIKQR